MMKSRLLLTFVLTGLILFGAASASAFAADPTPSNAQYGHVAGDSAGGTTHIAGTAGSLPFTGADVTVYVAAGLAMVGTGIALRRSARAKT
jgi:hypothetical protein